MTALPLFGDTSDIGAILNGPDQRAQIVRTLGELHQLVPFDHLDGPALAREKVLVLAQPRALSGAELVALDSWVRKGGRLLIFADPALLWPNDLPLGDPRRAPGIMLLDPLLNHWGLSLENPGKSESAISTVRIEGETVAVAAAGRWQSKTEACRITDQGVVAECRIGNGLALLIADADLLDERLWNESGIDNGEAIKSMLARVAPAKTD